MGATAAAPRAGGGTQGVPFRSPRPPSAAAPAPPGPSTSCPATPPPVTSLPGHTRRTAAEARPTIARPSVSCSATAGPSPVGGSRASRARGAACRIGGASPRAVPACPSASRGAASSYCAIGGASPRAIPVRRVRRSASHGAAAGPCAVSGASSRASRARPIVSRRAADTRTVSGAGASRAQCATQLLLGINLRSGVWACLWPPATSLCRPHMSRSLAGIASAAVPRSRVTICPAHRASIGSRSLFCVVGRRQTRIAIKPFGAQPIRGPVAYSNGLNRVCVLYFGFE